MRTRTQDVADGPLRAVPGREHRPWASGGPPLPFRRSVAGLNSSEVSDAGAKGRRTARSRLPTTVNGRGPGSRCFRALLLLVAYFRAVSHFGFGEPTPVTLSYPRFTDSELSWPKVRSTYAMPPSAFSLLL